MIMGDWGSYLAPTPHDHGGVDQAGADTGCGAMQYADEIVRQHERFFLGRTGPVRRELDEDEALAAMHTSDGIATWRWWTLSELDATDEVVWPPGLAGLIRGLLAG
jgi:hypothetical protein